MLMQRKLEKLESVPLTESPTDVLRGQVLSCFCLWISNLGLSIKGHSGVIFEWCCCQIQMASFSIHLKLCTMVVTYVSTIVGSNHWSSRFGQSFPYLHNQTKLKAMSRPNSLGIPCVNHSYQVGRTTSSKHRGCYWYSTFLFSQLAYRIISSL